MYAAQDIERDILRNVGGRITISDDRDRHRHRDAPYPPDDGLRGSGIARKEALVLCSGHYLLSGAESPTSCMRLLSFTVRQASRGSRTAERRRFVGVEEKRTRLAEFLVRI